MMITANAAMNGNAVSNTHNQIGFESCSDSNVISELAMTPLVVIEKPDGVEVTPSGRSPDGSPPSGSSRF
jgi:hypothetical protein